MDTYLNSRARINGTKIGDQFCVYTNDERTSFAVESDREHPRAFPVRVYTDNNGRRFLKESSEVIDVLKATGILKGTYEAPASRAVAPRKLEPPTTRSPVSIANSEQTQPPPKPDSTPAKRGEPQPRPVSKKK